MGFWSFAGFSDRKALYSMKGLFIFLKGKWGSVVMENLRLPSKMLEHVREYGDQETIIQHVVRVHLEYIKKNL